MTYRLILPDLSYRVVYPMLLFDRGLREINSDGMMPSHFLLGSRSMSVWKRSRKCAARKVCASRVTWRAFGTEELEGRILLSASHGARNAPVIQPAVAPTYYANTLGYLNTSVSGSEPYGGLTMDAAGNLYGTTQAGGAYGCGTIFEIPHGGSSPIALGSFDGMNGKTPTGPLLLDTAGNLFGTAHDGGANSDGTVFELARGSATIVAVASFNGTNGTAPAGGLTSDASGNLYGMTVSAGPNGDGTVFEIAHGGNSISIVAPLTSNTGNSLGCNLVIDSAGNIFGGTSSSVFEVAQGTHFANALIVFNNFNAPTGFFVSGIAADGAGNLFCATQSGANLGDGAVFKFNIATHVVTAEAQFAGSGYTTNGRLVLDSAGDLWGTTTQGGASGNGTIFEWVHGTSAITTAWSFAANDAVGRVPYGGLIQDAAGMLYGTALHGGPNSDGTVFQLSTAGGAPQAICAFGADMGQNFSGPLTINAAGDLYGFGTYGGAYGGGTIFEIPHGSSTPRLLTSIDPSTGSWLLGSPTLDSSGNLYGAVDRGGAFGNGALFELPAGASQVVTLASFQGGALGGGPGSTPVLDQNGNIFLSTYSAVVELPKGTTSFTVMTNSATAGGGYGGRLAVDGGGNVYGYTTTGGANSSGSLVRIAKGTTTVVTVAPFDSNSGGTDGLTVDGSGNVYFAGVTGFFKLAAGGSAFSSLGAFGGTAAPLGPPVFDAAGNLYEAAPNSLFELPQGSSQVQKIFDFTTSAATGSPQRGIVRDIQGDFYGTLYGSGPAGFGSVFELTTAPSANVISGTAAADVMSLTPFPDRHNIQWSLNGGQTFIVPIGDARGLTINGDGGNDTVVLNYANGNPLPNTVHFNGNFTVNAAAGAISLTGANFDIGQSTLFLSYGTSGSPAPQVRQALSAGFSGGAWNGLPGAGGAITSIAAATGPVGVNGVGYADSADGIVQGQPANTVEIRYTVMGDTNLDGVVNSTDAITMARNYLIAGRSSWDLGNFNYDDTISYSDALILQKNFGAAVTTSAATFAAATVSATQVATTSSSASDTPSGTGDSSDSGGVVVGRGQKRHGRFRGSY